MYFQNIKCMCISIIINVLMHLASIYKNVQHILFHICGLNFAFKCFCNGKIWTSLYAYNFNKSPPPLLEHKNCVSYEFSVKADPFKNNHNLIVYMQHGLTTLSGWYFFFKYRSMQCICKNNKIII